MRNFTHVGGARPEASASALRMRHAALSRPGKSLVLGSAPGNLGFPSVAKHMRRLFGPRGGAARRDVLVNAGIDASSEDEADSESRAARRKAKKMRKRGGRVAMWGKAKTRLMGDLSEPDSAEFRAARRIRNRRFRRDSQYRLPPKCFS